MKSNGNTIKLGMFSVDVEELNVELKKQGYSLVSYNSEDAIAAYNAEIDTTIKRMDDFLDDLFGEEKNDTKYANQSSDKAVKKAPEHTNQFSDKTVLSDMWK